MNTSDLHNKKIAILGLGIEGIALAEFFDANSIQYSLLDLMTEENLLNRAEDEGNRSLIELLGKISSSSKVFGADYLENLKDFDIIFRSPGIPYLHEKIQEARESGVQVSSQIKLFFDLCPAPIIGVTGTKGKGTTATLISEILKERTKHEARNTKQNSNFEIRNSKLKPQVFLAGNIGKPAISLLDDIQKEDWVILELSSFQLQDLEKSPHIAVVLNISQDHLDYHKNLTEYHEAKQSIVKYQSQNDFAVINQDYLTSFEFAALTSAEKFYFSSKNSVDQGSFVRKSIEGKPIKEVVLRYRDKEYVVCSSDEVALVGDHNLANIAAAAVAASIVGVAPEIISEVSKSFAGLPHRLEFVREIDGVKFYNDSFATNPEPTMAAIESFPESKIIILGGSSKGADFHELAKKISKSNVKAVVLIAQETENIKNALLDEAYSGQIILDSSSNINEVVRNSMKISQAGDVVILSPACASFGMFKNYKDRGEKFKKAVIETASSTAE